MRPPLSVIHILIVDDSAFVRKVVREMLSSSPFIEVVGVARDGVEALEQVEALKPHLVICDLMMPRLDGVGFVRQQMARAPLPILILSSAASDASKVLEALAAGAVDLVRKPTALANDDLLEVKAQLVQKVRATAQAPVETLAAPLEEVVRPRRETVAVRVEIVVIGISTGGPQALRRMLPQLSKDFPVPVAVVLHMPVGYTALYAEKLNELCPLEVKEAREGDPVQVGQILIAAAGRHLLFRRGADGVVRTELSIHPLEKLHRPSADVLFQSAAEVYGERVLAVVMTGMGDDGREGAAWVKAKGGAVITEAEKSCVIYGMPRSVVEAGLSDAAIPLDTMAQAITQRL